MGVVLGINEYMIAAISALTGVIIKMWAEIKQMAKQHMLCEVAQAGLRVEVSHLSKDLDRLRKSDATENSPGMWVIASTDGKILDAGGRVLAMLDYRDVELIGKSIDILIPQPLQNAHRSGLGKVAAGNPIRTRAIAESAITKSGKLLPVVVALSIVNEHGMRCVKAELFECDARSAVD